MLSNKNVVKFVCNLRTHLDNFLCILCGDQLLRGLANHNCLAKAIKLSINVRVSIFSFFSVNPSNHRRISTGIATN